MSKKHLTALRLMTLTLSCFILLCCDQNPKRIRQGNFFVEYIGDEKNGIEKKYSLDGLLVSETPISDSKPHGVKKEYYSNGNVSKELPCVNGVVEGIVKKYYTSGALYSESPTEKGKVHGLKKLFYEDGSIKAEAPFVKGKPQVGLKEYNKHGDLLPEPKIIINERDKTVLDGTFLVELELSKKQRKTTYYVVFTDSGKDFKIKLPVEGGKAVHIEHIPKGGVILKKLTFEVRYVTDFGNTKILKSNYTLAVSNRLHY
jgi:hypothetical protein